MKHVRVAAPACGAALWLLGAAGAAEGATVAPATECARFLPGIPTFRLTAAGFPAGAQLTFKADGAEVGKGVADPAGGFDNALSPFLAPEPAPKRNLRTFALTADDGRGTVAGPVPVRVTRIRVRMPDHARPSRKVRYRVYGFANDKRVYLHVRRKGRTLGRFSLGRTKGPCGRVTKRLRFMPLDRYGPGSYQYWFSHSRRFSRERAVYRIGVSIFETILPAQATAAGSA